MYIIDIIPITHLPRQETQILSYFNNESLPPGSLIQAKLNNRQIFGVVYASTPLEKRKISIKTADFTLKKIDKLLISGFVSDKQMQLANWMALYYFEDLSLVFKSILPKNIKSLVKSLASTDSIIANGTNKNQLISEYLPDRSGSPNTASMVKAIKASLKDKRQVLILNPTIAHLRYYQSILTKALGKKEKIAVFSNELPVKEFNKLYKQILTNEVKIIIGLRSSIFAPFQDLGLIIITDESNPSYKSWDQRPYYNARDAALYLGKIYGAKVLLQTSCPTIENYKSWPKNSYLHVKTEIVDLKQPKDAFRPILSDKLKEGLEEVVKKNGKAALFINRRGMAISILCQDCGYTFKCPNCEISLVYHKDNKNLLVCHHCGYKELAKDLCPNCKGHRLKPLGLGIEKIYEELKYYKDNFNTTIKRLDSESAVSAADQIKILDEFARNKNIILVGTELMFKPQLARVDLSAVVYVDPMLMIPDYQIEERVFGYVCFLEKIAKSRCLIQTYMPDNKIFESFANNQEIGFLEEESFWHKKHNWPPYCQIIKLTFGHKQDYYAKEQAELLKNRINRFVSSQAGLAKAIEVLGPAPAFISRERNLYKWNIIIKSNLNPEQVHLRNQILALAPDGWRIDVDPKDTL